MPELNVEAHVFEAPTVISEASKDDPNQAADAVVVAIGYPGDDKDEGEISKIYTMRGFDSSLGGYVHWKSDIVDRTGSLYRGDGPLSDIVLSNVRCGVLPDHAVSVQVATDGEDNVYIPESGEQWEELGFPRPTAVYLHNDESGSLQPSVGDSPLVPYERFDENKDLIEYQQEVEGWSTLWNHWPEGPWDHSSGNYTINDIYAGFFEQTEILKLASPHDGWAVLVYAELIDTPTDDSVGVIAGVQGAESSGQSINLVIHEDGSVAIGTSNSWPTYGTGGNDHRGRTLPLLFVWRGDLKDVFAYSLIDEFANKAAWYEWGEWVEPDDEPVWGGVGASTTSSVPAAEMKVGLTAFWVGEDFDALISSGLANRSAFTNLGWELEDIQVPKDGPDVYVPVHRSHFDVLGAPQPSVVHGFQGPGGASADIFGQRRDDRLLRSQNFNGTVDGELTVDGWSRYFSGVIFESGPDTGYFSSPSSSEPEEEATHRADPGESWAMLFYGSFGAPSDDDVNWIAVAHDDNSKGLQLVTENVNGTPTLKLASGVNTLVGDSIPDHSGLDDVKPYLLTYRADLGIVGLYTSLHTFETDQLYDPDILFTTFGFGTIPEGGQAGLSKICFAAFWFRDRMQELINANLANQNFISLLWGNG